MNEEPVPNPLTEDEKALFESLMPEDLADIIDTGVNRRHFLKLMSLAGAGMLAWQNAVAEQVATRPLAPWPETPFLSGKIENAVKVTMKVNGAPRSVTLDSRMTLLDTLRERLGLTGSKKGCDHGQCGACTVIVDGRRVLSCLTLAATCEGKTVKTIEGIAQGNTLHPVQEAFLKHDGFQCGFCTPGQICSAVAVLDEAKNGEASYVTADVRTAPKTGIKLSEEEIRERMSGNLCRCGAYPNIVAAIREVHSGKPVEQVFAFAG